MNKISSVVSVSLLFLSSIALTSCGSKGFNTPSSEFTPSSEVQTKFKVKNFYSISHYSSDNILNDKTVKWELNTAINCDGNPNGTTEIINQDSDPTFLLDIGKKCTISINTFKHKFIL